MLPLLTFVSWAANTHAARGSQDSYQQLLQHFSYDRSAPLDITRIQVRDKPGLQIIDLTYASPKGGKVPAYLVVPAQPGRHPAILYGHWGKSDAQIHDRREFLPEAEAMARSEVVCLLIDAPMSRPGYKPSSDPLSDQEPFILQQEVIDLRRGVDLLTERNDVDPLRIAYVGHSFNGGAGGILMGVEKRIAAFVIMAGGLSVREAVMSSATTDFRRQAGEDKVRAYLDKWDFVDPVHYLAHAAPAPVLLQYGRSDPYESVAAAEHYYALVSRPKDLMLYDAGHALNAKARLDRAAWLGRVLGFKPDLDRLRAVPDIK